MGILSQIFAISALALALASPAFGQGDQRTQRAVLYDDYDGAGNYIVLPDYADDLGRVGWDNRVRSACVTGVWLFYQDPTYNSAGSRGMEFVFGRQNYCVNLRTIANHVSSVRFSGAPRDYDTASLTLYEGDYFQGAEEYALRSLPNLNLADNHKSIIITGSSDWEVFDLPNYRGNSLCLRVPEPGSPSFINDLETLDPIIPHGSIRSVSKGCLSAATQNYTLSSFARAGPSPKNTFVQPKLV